MITVLLEKIITILEGWIQSFTSHAQHVEDKLDSLDQTASDIKTNTDPISDIADNTGAVVTPIQNIKSNTDSIKQSSQTSANNTTAILNNVSTLSTNTGRAAAFAEDCANNTLDIKDKITTIASDTTQIRADNANIAADVSSINQAIGYYVANTLVTEDSEGALCNFDTDLEDYLQKAVVTIPADPTGYTGINLIKNNKNLYSLGDKTFSLTTDYNLPFLIPEGNYTFSGIFNSTDTDRTNCAVGFVYEDDTTNLKLFSRGVRTFNTFTFTKKVKALRVYASESYPASTGDTGTFTNMQLEAGSAMTGYVSSQNMTYSVSFGSTITDGAEVDLLSGLVKVNTTPESFIQIQPIAVRTYKGVNNIFSDVGSTALTYRETLKKYLEKHNQ